MSNVAPLARAWLDAKAAEQAAVATRISIEAQLAAALGTRAEGSETHHVPGYRITLTQPVYRKVDEAAWKRVAAHCPPFLKPVKLRLEADATGIKWLMAHEPAVWRRIAEAFTTTPGKVGVKIEEEVK
jgi:hypothetical protein